MADNSEDIKRNFEEKFNFIEKQDKIDRKIKIGLLNASCIIAFLFVFTGMILSYVNYKNEMAKNDNEENVIQKVVVEEY